jgi:hypothetical protein
MIRLPDVSESASSPTGEPAEPVADSPGCPGAPSLAEAPSTGEVVALAGIGATASGWSPVPFRAYACLPGWCSRYPEPCPVCSPGEVPEPRYQGESLQQREHRVSRMADMALVHEALDDLGVPRDLLRARLAYLRGLVAGLREGR